MIVAPSPPPDPAIPLNRVLFEDWVPASLSAAPLTPPEPCLICGAEQNVCTTHSSEIPIMRETKIQGTADANADPASNLFVCPDDVVEEYQTGLGTNRPSWRLLHAKGDVISRERAIALGLIDAPADAPSPGPLSMEARTTTEGHSVTVPQQ